MSNPARGRRFALARRLLGAFEGQDLPAPALALRLGKDKKQVYRYERGDDRAPEGTVDTFVELCVAAGLPITASWLERGETELPALVVPAAALAVAIAKPKAVKAPRGAPVGQRRKPAVRSGVAGSKRVGKRAS